MNLPRSKRFWTELPRWAQTGLIVAVWLLVSLMCPRGVRFDYSYEQGQRWRYGTLVAPFDFPIRKTDAEIGAERRLRREGTDPYLAFDETAGAAAMERYRASFGESLARIDSSGTYAELRLRPDRYFRRGAELIVGLYERGIVERAPQLSSPPNGVVRIVRGGTIAEANPSELVDLEDARAAVADSLRQDRLRDAGFLTAVIQTSLRPNVAYSDSLTRRFAAEAEARVVESRGMVRAGEIIVAEDGLITAEAFRKLRSYQLRYESTVVSGARGYVMLFGYFFLVGVIMSTLLLYLRTFHPEVLGRFNRLAFLMLLLLVATFAVYRIEALTKYGIYVMPFVLIPIIVRNFFPAGVALFTHLVVVLIAGFISPLGYEFTFLQLIAGIVAVLVPNDAGNSGDNIRLIGVLLGTYLVGYLGLELTKEGDWSEINWVPLPWLGLSLVLSLLAGPLVPLFGRVFGFPSDFAYRELLDVNGPVLKELALRAPGTFQHSLAVSNLAETAVREIGGEALLVKVAALYHDIGKMSQPFLFIENQTGRNPHEQFGPRESAAVIIGHVAEGVRRAEEANLPREIVDVIRTHHGTTRVEFFYRIYLSEHPEGEADEAAFRYPGPLPQTREQGVLMIADSVEAAGRAMKDPTAEGIDQLVDGLIDAKRSMGQFDQCALSFKELEQCRALFKRMLKVMYHARVEYPDMDVDQETAAEVATES